MGKRVLMTNPGLLGDMLFSATIAAEYHRQTGNSVDFCVPSQFRDVEPLFSREPWCDKVFYEENVKSHDGFSNEDSFWIDNVSSPETDAQYDEVYHLGFRKPPHEHLTIAQWRGSGVPIDPSMLQYVRCFSYILPSAPIRTLCLHLTSRDMWRVGDARKVVWDIMGELVEHFDRIYLIGIPEEERHYDLLKDISKCEFFRGDLVELSQLLSQSVFCGGCSSIAALVSGIKSRGVILIPDNMQHGARAEHFMTCASNYGDNQITMWANDPMKLLQSLYTLSNT